MSERLFAPVRLLRLALIVSIALILGQVLSGHRGGAWVEFVSAFLLRGTTAEEYASLRALADGADLVVVGRISGIERGRELVAAPELLGDPVVGDFALVRFAVATIEIEQNLTKGVAAGPNVDVEILVLQWEQVSELENRLPKERGLFFLHHKEAEADGRYYRLVNVHQGLVGSEGGVAVVPTLDAADGENFLALLHGRDFEEVVEQVKTEIEP